jgi:PAS domain S-box-containing protein
MSLDAVIVLDADGQVTEWNPGAATMFGWPADEIIGRPVAIITDEAGAEQQRRILERINQGERNIVYEARRLRRDGTVVELSVNLAAIRDSTGTITGTSVVARDIGAAKEAADRQRALEERTHQAQRMESLGKLAGGIAHDFNNVLATVTLTAELLAAGTDDPDVQAGLARILGSARSATDLTGRLLLFARQQPTNPRPVDIPSAVGRVLDILEGTVGSTIAVDVDVDGCPPVLIDPTHLEQVLLNLVINARDAMPHGGKLSVSAVEVDSGTRLDGRRVETGLVALTVTDTGEGMSAEVRARALEPFFTTKGAGRGTGLGLSTVHGIVSTAGGHISIFSEPGLGSAVRVELPVADRDHRARATVVPTAERGHGERLLVVEDQDDLRRVVAQILASAGYSVTSAATGNEAAAMLVYDGGPDLVVSDVVMPGMTGPELARKLTEVRPGTPVVFMSGYAGGVLESHGVLAEHPVLPKPFTSEALLTAVADALRRSAPRHG